MLSLIVIAVIAYVVYSKFFANSTDETVTPETTTDPTPNPTKAAFNSFKQGVAPAVDQVKTATAQAKATYAQTSNDKMVAELMSRLNKQMADKADAGEDTAVDKDQVLNILSDIQANQPELFES